MTDNELEQIYNEAYKPVYWTAMSLLKNETDAEDIVQDAFVTLIESYDSIKDKSKVTSWLKKTAANKCLDRIKLARTDNMDDEFFESCEAIPEDFLPDSIVESDEARKIVMNIINNSLSDDIRRTLILFYFDDMSIKEIALALGVPEGTVSRRLNFARNKIKKEVEKYEKDNNYKLYAMGIPFLTKLFVAEAARVPFKVMPASLASASASAKLLGKGASKTISDASKEAARKGASALVKKIAIGAAAVTLVGAGIAVVVNYLTPEDPYRKALTTLMNDQILPDGSRLEMVDGSTLAKDCWFDVVDFDQDGTTELMIDYVPGYNGNYPVGYGKYPNRSTYIFEYHSENDSWEMEFHGIGIGFSHPSDGKYGSDFICTARFEESHIYYDWYQLNKSTHEYDEYVGSLEEFFYDTYDGELPSEYEDDGVVYIIDFPDHDREFCSETEYWTFLYQEIGEPVRFKVQRWTIKQDDIDEFIQRKNAGTL